MGWCFTKVTPKSTYTFVFVEMNRACNLQQKITGTLANYSSLHLLAGICPEIAWVSRQSHIANLIHYHQHSTIKLFLVYCTLVILQCCMNRQHYEVSTSDACHLTQALVLSHGSLGTTYHRLIFHHALLKQLV